MWIFIKYLLNSGSCQVRSKNFNFCWMNIRLASFRRKTLVINWPPPSCKMKCHSSSNSLVNAIMVFKTLLNVTANDAISFFLPSQLLMLSLTFYIHFILIYYRHVSICWRINETVEADSSRKRNETSRNSLIKLYL